jgi:phage terminase large subunit
VKPSSYEHEYLGVVTGTGGEIFDNVQCRPISDEEIANFTNIHRGLDFGYAIDPLAYTVMHYDRKYKRLYIFHELYKVRLSNHAAYQELKRENKDNQEIIADSAEPKSISELNQYGLRIRGVKKGPDSIEYGIKFLQDLEEIIIDDTRCPETAREFLTYELDKDANGNFKAGYPDHDNHTIDSVRYGMNDECIDFMNRLKKQKDDPVTTQEKIQAQIKRMKQDKKKVNLL